MKEELVGEIVRREWDMFQKVINAGGRASCQEDLKTFAVMRTSQVMVWNEPMLESYLNDIKTADAAGRNLMTEKYARMMESTHPEEYRGIEGSLPLLDKEVYEYTERIVALMTYWGDEMELKYPSVIKTGRPIHRFKDTAEVTSLETYTRGELYTYGIETLKLCWEYYSKCIAEGINIYEKVLKNTVKAYGYSTIQEAEDAEQKKN